MPANLLQPSNVLPLRPTASTHEQQLADARKLQGAFQDFVGKTFYAEMLKSMRSTLGKPAYFHGGNAEEIFQSQLDQQITDELSNAGADDLSGAMFRLQFPKQAALIAEADRRDASSLSDLSALRRR